MLIITSITWIFLVLVNLQSGIVSGERSVGFGIIVLAVLIAFILSSLILTIGISASGGFNWISNSGMLRYSAIAVFWLGTVAGVVYCTMLKIECRLDEKTGLIDLVTKAIYFGGAWMPLLLIIPCAILINQDWKDNLSPYLYKTPMIFSSLLGFALWFIPRGAIITGIFTASGRDAFFSMQTIHENKSIESLLHFLGKGIDELHKNAAISQIKKNKDWELELKKLLAKDNPYDNCLIYSFLVDNPVVDKDAFALSINKSIPVLAARYEEVIQNEFSRYSYSVESLNTDVLCKLLETRFKDYSTTFRPNLVKLNETLEKPLAGTSDETRAYSDTLNNYRLCIHQWLENNKN